MSPVRTLSQPPQQKLSAETGGSRLSIFPTQQPCAFWRDILLTGWSDFIKSPFNLSSDSWVPCLRRCCRGGLPDLRSPHLRTQFDHSVRVVLFTLGRLEPRSVSKLSLPTALDSLHPSHLLPRTASIWPENIKYFRNLSQCLDLERTDT